jgi:hypothetical protein
MVASLAARLHTARVDPNANAVRRRVLAEHGCGEVAQPTTDQEWAASRASKKAATQIGFSRFAHQYSDLG